MPQQMSNYFVQLLEDQWFGKLATPTVPANWYVCMFLTDPGLADSGGVEVTIGGASNYLRLLIANDSSHFAAAASRAKVCAGGSFPLAWFTAGAAVGPIVATGLRDAASGGNLILLNSIASGSQQSIAIGNNITFNAADFSFRID
jgi:hypothetical protein